VTREALVLAKDTVIAGIEIGSSKICALMGKHEREGYLHVIGVGVVPSRGIRRGVVVNVEEAGESIAAAVERAERVSGYKIVSAYVTVSGGHISSQNNRGVVAVTRADRTIRQEDVKRAMEAARVLTLPSDRQIVHALPRAFEVDGQDGVRNPVGMLGYRLDVETHIVTGSTTAIQNMTQCLRRAGIGVDGLVLEPLASAEAVLSEEEKEMGVALVDIGGGTTNLAVFTEGTVCHTAIIGVGGGHVTNDVAVGLRTPLGVAEELKIKYGHALAAAVPDEAIQTSTFNNSGEEVSRKELVGIMEARLEEICALVGAEIARAGYGGLLPAGIVLTGGSAETPGLDELAREVCRTPVRIGRHRRVTGLAEMVRGPAYAAAVGLLLWGARAGESVLVGASTPTSRAGKHESPRAAETTSAYGRFVSWLRSFLP
jgi:cell division protein FtsA